MNKQKTPPMAPSPGCAEASGGVPGILGDAHSQAPRSLPGLRGRGFLRSRTELAGWPHHTWPQPAHLRARGPAAVPGRPRLAGGQEASVSPCVNPRVAPSEHPHAPAAGFPQRPRSQGKPGGNHDVFEDLGSGVTPSSLQHPLGCTAWSCSCREE